MTSQNRTLGNLLTAKVQIEGTRTLIWNHFGVDAIPLEKQEREGTPGNNPEEWRKTVLTTADGQLYLLNSYIFRCIRDASPFIKRGKAYQTAVAATLQVVEDTLLLPDLYLPQKPMPIEQGQSSDKAPSVYLLVAGVKKPATGKRNIRYRIAAKPGWQCEFTLLWDKTVISRDEMKALCLSAGQMVGIGDGRAIGFGRFVVREFKVQPMNFADTS
jgi:hypothetical protein